MSARSGNGAAAMLLAALALATGCGGEEGSSSAAESPGPDEVLRCLESQGLDATLTPPNETVQKIGPVGALFVEVPPRNRITVDFFDDPEKAKDYAEAEDGFYGTPLTGGGAEVHAETIVVAIAQRGNDEELRIVEECVNS
jgi:hypothetical protein